MGTHPIFESDFDCLTDMPSTEGTECLEALEIALNSENSKSYRSSAASNHSNNLYSYDLSGQRDLIIVNISKYEKSRERRGSNADVLKIENSFGYRNFKLFNKLTGNVKKRDVENCFRNYVNCLKTSNSNVSVLAIAIMSHGSYDDRIVFSDESEFKLLNILQTIIGSQELRGVPKIIIGQFCRGQN